MYNSDMNFLPNEATGKNKAYYKPVIEPLSSRDHVSHCHNICRTVSNPLCKSEQKQRGMEKGDPVVIRMCFAVVLQNTYHGHLQKYVVFMSA